MEWALRKLQTNLIVNHINKSPMIDPTSQSNYLQIATAHIAFDWIIDFQQKVLRGSAVHHLSVKTTGVSEVMYVRHLLLSSSFPHIAGTKF
jgi:leukotriene-A4 hydrolase